MLIRTSLKQTLRTPVKLIAYFLVTALAAASFCVGLNQETSAQNNFAAAEESFTTVAVPTLYADSTPDGYLYHALEPEEFQKLISKYTMKYMPREYFTADIRRLHHRNMTFHQFVPPSAWSPLMCAAALAHMSTDRCFADITLWIIRICRMSSFLPITVKVKLT